MKVITKAFIGVVILAIVVFDVFVIIKDGRQASISWVMIEAAEQYPMIPFLVGFVMGHLFWRMKDPEVKK